MVYDACVRLADGVEYKFHIPILNSYKKLPKKRKKRSVDRSVSNVASEAQTTKIVHSYILKHRVKYVDGQPVFKYSGLNETRLTI